MSCARLEQAFASGTTVGGSSSYWVLMKVSEDIISNQSFIGEYEVLGTNYALRDGYALIVWQQY